MNPYRKMAEMPKVKKVREPMRQITKDQIIVGCMFLVIALVLGVFLMKILSMVEAAERIEREEGVKVCGQVETRTPQGERAMIEKCWRQKP